MFYGLTTLLSARTKGEEKCRLITEEEYKEYRMLKEMMSGCFQNGNIHNKRRPTLKSLICYIGDSFGKDWHKWKLVEEVKSEYEPSIIHITLQCKRCKTFCFVEKEGLINER